MTIDLAGISAIIITPLIRGITGWLQNALDEGSDMGTTISNWEWQQLISTILRVGLSTIAIYYGIGSIPGLDIPALSAGAAAFLFDLVYTRITKK